MNMKNLTMSERIAEQLKNGTSINADGMQIRPNNTYVLFKPYEKNPYQAPETRESGLIISDNGKFKNPDSGEEEEMNIGILVGKVLEVGPDCKYVKPGDDIYYQINSIVPIPFYRQGVAILAEQKILMILNTDLDVRFNK